MSSAPLIFKIAALEEEFAQIHRLNNRTFAKEIPQHAPSADSLLRDRFHEENLYFVALRGEKLVGMVALRDKRPFSLDEKLANLDKFLPPHHFACEIRLLAVTHEERRGKVFHGLLRLLSGYCAAHGYDLALISGTTRQQKLYRHLGFRPFGPLVGTPDAEFQPMYLTKAALEAALGRPVNLLPGPIELRPAVRVAFSNALWSGVSHRSAEFHRLLDETRDKLRRLTGASQVEIAVGTGTLANDIVAAQLSLLPGPGLVISNGEFGDRLEDHARRFKLDFFVSRKDWGANFDWDTITHSMRSKRCRWLWATHCETSTGTLNDLAALKSIATACNAPLCLDCVSSLGAMPLDLNGVFLATGSSGKALGAPAGLALIFSGQNFTQVNNALLPRYLDLGFCAREEPTPFTHSTPLVAALCAALDFQNPDFWRHLAEIGHRLRASLSEVGFQFVASRQNSAPHVLTLSLPTPLCSFNIGEQLEQHRFVASYRSAYLRRRNWLQFCLMCEHPSGQVEKLPALLHRITQQIQPSNSD